MSQRNGMGWNGLSPSGSEEEEEEVAGSCEHGN